MSPAAPHRRMTASIAPLPARNTAAAACDCMGGNNVMLDYLVGGRQTMLCDANQARIQAAASTLSVAAYLQSSAAMVVARVQSAFLGQQLNSCRRPAAKVAPVQQ